MATDDSRDRGRAPDDVTETLIRVGVLAVLVFLCVQVSAPFAYLVLWAVILAIALYPLQRAIARRMGGRSGRAATALVLVGLLLVGVPTVMLGASFASHLHDIYVAFDDQTLRIQHPDPSVADWPLIGGQVYALWSDAAGNLPAFLREYRDQLMSLFRGALGAAASTAGSVLLFLASLIVAAFMMAYGEACDRAIGDIFNRLTDSERGSRLKALSTATVRSVAVGVIGVAFIQALLVGVGFLLAGIPAAGVLALVVMFIGILQLPALLVTLPAIAYLWWAGDSSTTANALWTVYLILAGMSDSVLKPMLLGRGVEAPMLVILIGALGGMITSGMIGLFGGAVVLAVGYQVFMEWVGPRPSPAIAGTEPASGGADSPPEEPRTGLANP